MMNGVRFVGKRGAEAADEILLCLLHSLTVDVETAEVVLARAAISLRELEEAMMGRKLRRRDEDEEEEGEGEEMRKKKEKEVQTLCWRRARIVAEFGLSKDRRLLLWLQQMALKMVKNSPVPRRKVIGLIATRFEWVTLRLALHSLPPICSPRVPHRHLPEYSFAGPPIFQASSEAAARVDLAGGWTDTPPITYQCPDSPAVLNLAIKVNGKRPLRCHCARLQHLSGVFYTEGSGEQCGGTAITQHFPTADSVFDLYDWPSHPGSLLCAILIVSGIAREELVGGERIRRFCLGGPGRGLYIRTDSDLPHGSGLGTSSILSGAVLAALWRLCGKQHNDQQLVHAVLRVEASAGKLQVFLICALLILQQLHTTGGGWQDQIGGCVPGGFKLSTVSPAGSRHCLWHPVPVPASLLPRISSRLLLVYTGRTRLAKHVLQRVLLQWLAGQRPIRQAVQRLAEGARRAEAELREGKFPASLCRDYNALKKEFTPSTEPPEVGALIRALVGDGLAEVAWVAGAGGGGFLYVWLAEGRSAAELERWLAADPRWSGMSVWRAEMEEREPLVVR